MIRIVRRTSAVGLQLNITSTGEYSALHPYNSFTADGLNIHNLIEHSKLYSVSKGAPTEEFYAWRAAGYCNPTAVIRPGGLTRPIGFFAPNHQWMTEREFQQDYAMPVYMDSLMRNPVFLNLQQSHRNKIDLHIMSECAFKATRASLRQQFKHRNYHFTVPFVMALLNIHPRELS